VGGHQSVGMADQVEPISGSRQHVEIRRTAVVAVAENDPAPPALARCDVVYRAPPNSSRRGLAVPRFRFEKLDSGLDRVPCVCHVRRDADALDRDAPHPGS
jgi:hypothetical protein